MASDRRFQIFVSSTFNDLIEERRAIMQALLSLDHFPAGMELFPATNDDQWTLIKSVIDDSDYYVIVVGGRYGSTTPEGISYTEKEFDYATQQKKPVLAFVHAAPDAIPAGKTDKNDAARVKLDAFRKKVQTGRVTKTWSTAADLQAAVLQSVVTETKKNPQEGWVRGNLASDPATLAALREEILELKEQGPPKDAHDYVGGETMHEVHIRFQKTSTTGWATHTVKMEWDWIFREVGPILMQEATETAMRSRFVAEVLHYDNAQKQSVGGAYNSSISNEEFDTIKVQLFALGLIRKGTQKRTVSDKNAYWTLTEHGEAHLMRLRAIRKDEVK